VLGLDPDAGEPATKSDAAWALLERDLRKLWEESPDRARQMAKLLDAMAKLALG
jgi:hypothetical protein